MTSTPISEKDVAELPTVWINEPLDCSMGDVPYNKPHLDARDAEIRRLRKDFEIARTAGRLFEQASNDWMVRASKAECALAQSQERDAEIRRAAIEECAKIAITEAAEYQREIDEHNKTVTAWTSDDRERSVYLHAKRAASDNIAGLIALAQQQADGEVKT